MQSIPCTYKLKTLNLRLKNGLREYSLYYLKNIQALLATYLALKPRTPTIESGYLIGIADKTLKQSKPYREDQQSSFL